MDYKVNHKWKPTGVTRERGGVVVLCDRCGTSALRLEKGRILADETTAALMVGERIYRSKNHKVRPCPGRPDGKQ